MTTKNTLSGEIWKTLPKELNLSNYKVSDRGCILNVKTNRITTGHRRKERKNRTTTQLTTDDGKRKSYQLHRLVAYAFNKNDDPENKKVVDHINRDPSFNNKINLRWATVAENNKNCVRISAGRKRGIVHLDGNGKLIKEYEKAKDAAYELNIDLSSIIKCCKGKRPHAKNNYFKYSYDFFGDLPDELWRPLTLKNNIKIRVSNQGRVQDKFGVTYGYDTNGYKYIQKQGKAYPIHVLVAKAWHPETYKKGLVPDHLNEIKSDNRSVNLEWVTPAENTKRAHNKCVVHTTLKNKYIRHFDSVKEAGNITKVDRRLISAVVSGNQKTTGGYKWYHYADFFNLFPFITYF